MKIPSREEFSVQGVQRSLVGAEDLIGNIEQGFVHQTEVFGQRGFAGVEVEQSSDVLFVGFSLVKRRQCRHGVAGVVFGRDGFQSDG